MNAAMQIATILVLTGIAVVLLLRRRVNPWEACRPPSSLERELRWIDRYAPPWQSDERKEMAIRKRRMDAALDQRAARLARVRQP